MRSKFAWFSAICASLVAVPAAAQEARWGSPDDPTVKQMLAGEKMWLDARQEDALSSGSAHDCTLGEVRYHFFGESVAVAYGSESSIERKEDGSEIIAAQDNEVECEAR